MAPASQDDGNNNGRSQPGVPPSQEDLTMQAVQQKYAQEVAKRMKPEGAAQYIPLKDSGSSRLEALNDDPWADHAALNAKEPVKNGATYTFVILGAGYGGLLAAVRLIQAGVASGPDDIRLIDTAGGFGGTWWWNRFPGLHCDTESYIYMPLLEETGYMPSSKYVSGPELLEHADRIAEQWNLGDKALFRSKVEGVDWDGDANLWNVNITEGRGPGEEKRALQIRTQYFLAVGGILKHPQVPKIEGLESFAGDMFHTSRWNYKVTGGSPGDQSLEGLKDKRVGILGTGATAIQAVPQLAKWAKELYVFQRTPSIVSWRGQRETDVDEWKTKIAQRSGWQQERNENFNDIMSGNVSDGKKDMIGDGWTGLKGFITNSGSEIWGIIEPTPERIGEHIARINKIDFPITEAIRQRVDQIVQNPEVAAKLKAWYPTFCKRPTFSDEYLQAFNLGHVHLVDTDGKGVESATKDGLVAGGKEYPLDVLVLGTGYESTAVGLGDPAISNGIKVTGRGGRSMSEKWQKHGMATLHGVCSNGFPNLFFTGVFQNASSPSFTFALDSNVKHIAHIIREAEKRVQAGPKSRPVIEVSVDAEEGWSLEIMKRSAFFAPMMACTPSYFNLEGDVFKIAADPAQQVKIARASAWGGGLNSLNRVLQEYRDEGSLKGVEITAVAAG